MVSKELPSSPTHSIKGGEWEKKIRSLALAQPILLSRATLRRGLTKERVVGAPCRRNRVEKWGEGSLLERKKVAVNTKRRGDHHRRGKQYRKGVLSISVETVN